MPDGRTALWLAAVDPGLQRLRVASRSALAVALALVGEWLFVTGTGALEVPTAGISGARLAAAGAQHHEILVVAMLLGGLVAMLGGINANELTFRSQLVTLGYIGSAVAAALAFGLAIGTQRTAALALMVVLLVIGAYGRRFGQRGAATGVILFIGYFYGFFLAPALGVGAAGWLAAEIGVAVVAGALVRAALFRPDARRDLELSLWTYRARRRRVLLLSLRLLDGVTDGRRRGVQQALVSLDEAALIVEGQLQRPGAPTPSAARAVHEHVFDTEAATANVARFVLMLTSLGVGDDQRQLVRRALTALVDGRPQDARDAVRAVRGRAGDGSWAHAAVTVSVGHEDDDELTRWVVLHRFANAVDDLVAANARWAGAQRAAGAGAARDAGAAEGAGGGAGVGADVGVQGFTPAVTLRGGWLPGSADVSGEAAILPSARLRLAPYVRTTAQMAVAVTIAIVAGDALDSQRFYWAVVAALLALVGTNTVAEQLRKAAHRVVGTLAGVVVGTALVEAVGHHSVWSLVVVVVSIWIGVYFFRVNYAVMAMAVTVSLSQAYLSLGEFSNGLLWERLAETAVGAAAAMVTVVVVLPLRTKRVVDVALAGLTDAAAALSDSAAAALDGTGSPTALRGAGRQVDAAFQALVATAEPLRLVAWTDSADRLTRQMAAATAARNYARNLVTDAAAAAGCVPLGWLAAARAQQQRSAGVLATSLREGSPTGRFVRAASLYSLAERELLAGGDPAGADTQGGTGERHSERAAQPGAAQPGAAQPGAAGQTADLDGSLPSPSQVLAARDLVLLDGALAALALATGLTVEHATPRTVVEEARRIGGRTGASGQAPTGDEEAGVPAQPAGAASARPPGAGPAGPGPASAGRSGTP